MLREITRVEQKAPAAARVHPETKLARLDRRRRNGGQLDLDDGVKWGWGEGWFGVRVRDRSRQGPSCGWETRETTRQATQGEESK
jgi:hypothetical protein